MEVSRYSIEYPLNISFYALKCVTTSKMLNIFLQSIDQGINIPRLRNVVYTANRISVIKFGVGKNLWISDVGVSGNLSFHKLLACNNTVTTSRRKMIAIVVCKFQEPFCKVLVSICDHMWLALGKPATYTQR